MGNVVLLVDDVKGVREPVAQALTQALDGAAPAADDVLQAANNAEAIEILGEHATRINRIIIDDIHDDDPEAGIKLIRHIRETDKTTPIALLSAAPKPGRHLATELEALGVQFIAKSEGLHPLKEWIADPLKAVKPRRALS